MVDEQQKLYRLENNERVYDYKESIEDIFYSEMCLNFNYHLSFGAKIFYIVCESKNFVSLKNKELNYLYTLDARFTEELNYVFSQNIKNIKCNQRSDLFFLTNLKCLYFVCLIPKLNNNNCYYFNLIIGVKSEFNVNQIYDWNLNSVIISNLTELNKFSLDIGYMTQIFDLLNNKFKDVRISKEEGSIWPKYLTNGIKDINSKLTKAGVRIYKKMIFKRICYHFYWMDGYYQINNTHFWMDHGYKEKIIIKNNGEDLQIKETYHFSSLADIMSSSPEYICFSWWEIYDD
jgi:hypothetical protein